MDTGSTRRRPVRPPRLPNVPSLPRGPKLYQQPKGYPLRYGGMGPAPGEFPGTEPEWRAYYACWRIFDVPGDPQDSGPDYWGAPGIFAFQDPFEGGRIGGPGGQVFDFVVYTTSQGTAIIFRVQTEYFHYQADNRKQVSDALLLARASRFYQVIDVYDYELMADETGEAAVVTIKRALSGQRAQNPLTAGVTRRV